MIGRLGNLTFVSKGIPMNAMKRECELKIECELKGASIDLKRSSNYHLKGASNCHLIAKSSNFHFKHNSLSTRNLNAQTSFLFNSSPFSLHFRSMRRFTSYNQHQSSIPIECIEDECIDDEMMDECIEDQIDQLDECTDDEVDDSMHSLQVNHHIESINPHNPNPNQTALLLLQGAPNNLTVSDLMRMVGGKSEWNRHIHNWHYNYPQSTCSSSYRNMWLLEVKSPEVVKSSQQINSHMKKAVELARRISMSCISGCRIKPTIVPQDERMEILKNFHDPVLSGGGDSKMEASLILMNVPFWVEAEKLKEVFCGFRLRNHQYSNDDNNRESFSSMFVPSLERVLISPSRAALWVVRFANRQEMWRAYGSLNGSYWDFEPGGEVLLRFEPCKQQEEP